MRRLGLGALALLLLAAWPGAAAGQGGSTIQHVTRENGHTLRVRVHGSVEFTDDDRGIRSVSRGGRVTLEESFRGGPHRRAEFWSTASGELRRAYYLDGEAHAFDADARAWVERTLEGMARESAVGAERRVARLRQRGGVPAVLGYVRDIRSDGAKRAYYVALLRSGGLSGAEVASVLEDAGRRIDSDGETRYVLKTALDQGLRGREAWAGFFRAAGGIDSDGEARYLLAAAAAGAPLDDDAVRRDFFRATGEIDSDGERRYVLTAVLRRSGVGPALAADVLRSAGGISSDGEKAYVLVQVPRALLAHRAVGDAYLAAAEGIGSDGERSRVLTHLARSRP
ncbi:MAG TPA: hypothetical protein VFX98_08470 [Longimicrobiaceae bacterium]|nr:hypothetical protein [Longimicrobiaceae bacterium]